jgi:RNA polymerase sigma-70 factor (ECF subfamily)
MPFHEPPIPRHSPRETPTNVTLLGRLRAGDDQLAWQAFVENYTPMIYHWCRKFGLQESDAADATQTVLLKLVRGLRNFVYTPERGSFRGWLKTVTSNAVRDLIQHWKQHQRGSGDTQNLQRLAALPDARAIEALAADIEAQHELELLHAAEQVVETRVKPHTWQAYRMTAWDGCRVTDVAAQVGMTVAEVYVAKSRVIKMLREQIQLLEEGEPGGRLTRQSS